MESNTINEVFGFINNFVEHENLKSVVVANEKEIIRKFNEPGISYKIVKEKLIRFTYWFNPSLEDVFKDLAFAFDPKPLQDFLIANRKSICNGFRKGNHQNLRTLKFVMDNFSLIFKTVNEDARIMAKYRDPILENYIFSLVVYSIEYKKELDTTKLLLLKEVSNSNRYLFRLMGRQLDESENLDKKIKSPASDNEVYVNMIEETYLEDSENSYYYYEWIVPLVHSGILDTVSIGKESLRIQGEIIEKETSPEFIKLGKLENWLILENSEVDEAISNVLKDVQAGKFQLQKYPHIFSVVEIVCTNTNCSYSIDEEMIPVFKKGMEVSKLQSEYIKNLGGRSPLLMGKLSRELKEIEEYCDKLNDSLLLEFEERIASRFRNALNPYDKFKLQEIIFENEAYENAFFHLIDPAFVYEIFISLRNEEKREFYDIFQKMAGKYHNFHQAYKKEIEFFEELKRMFDENSEKSISRILCKWMSDLVNNVLNEITSYR